MRDFFFGWATRLIAAYRLVSSICIHSFVGFMYHKFLYIYIFYPAFLTMVIVRGA